MRRRRELGRGVLFLAKEHVKPHTSKDTIQQRRACSARGRPGRSTSERASGPAGRPSARC